MSSKTHYLFPPVLGVMHNESMAWYLFDLLDETNKHITICIGDYKLAGDSHNIYLEFAFADEVMVMSCLRCFLQEL